MSNKRTLLLSLGLCLAFLNLYRAVEIHSYDEALYKDFAQEYVISKAIMSGVSLDESVKQLRSRFLETELDSLDHPTPHPPFLGLFLTPLFELGFTSASLAWVVMQVVFMALLSREIMLLASATKSVLLPCFLYFLSSSLAGKELATGNVNVLKVLLEVAALRFMLEGKDKLAGFSAALSFLVKLGGWPLVILFVFEKRLTALIAFAVVVIFSFGLLEISQDSFSAVSYFTSTLPLVSELYMQSPGNVSLASFAAKILSGVHLGTYSGILGPSETGFIAAKVVAAGALVLVVSLAFRQRDAKLRGMTLITAAPFILPLSWWTSWFPVLAFVAWRFCKLDGKSAGVSVVLSLIFLHCFNLWYRFVIGPAELYTSILKDICLFSYYLFPIACFVCLRSLKFGRKSG